MPCYDSRDSASEARWETAQLQRRLNTLTDMLCRTLNQAEKTGLKLAPDVQEWWTVHKELDKMRATNIKTRSSK